jgi:beta-galactosidase
MWYKGGNPFDGGNCKQLNNPPFTFKNIVWKKGDIVAVGYINGHEECRHSVTTPDKPAKLEISYFEKGKPAATNDMLIVYVSIKDKNGTLCISDTSKVSLIVENGGEVVGPAEINAEAGIASFLVRTGEEKELIMKVQSLVGNATKILSVGQ